MGSELTVGKSIVSDIVPRTVEEDEEDDCNSGCFILSTSSDCPLNVRHWYRPCNIDELDVISKWDLTGGLSNITYQHTNSTSQEHGSAIEARRDQGDCSTVNE